jgi:hypothetical protein
MTPQQKKFKKVAKSCSGKSRAKFKACMRKKL